MDVTRLVPSHFYHLKLIISTEVYDTGQQPIVEIYEQTRPSLSCVGIGHF